MAAQSAVTYYVAGKANDDSFAKAEHLAEVLMSSLPSATCHILPTLPDAWPALSKSTCARLGCKEVHPLVWTGNGRLVGSLAEFERECLAKYNLKVDSQIRPSQWTKIAKENAAHAQTLASGATGAPIPEGEGRGLLVSEALLDGHRRFLGTDPPGPPPPSDTVDATIVLVTPLPAGLSVEKLLDTPKENLFVVPCATPVLDPLTVGNIEHAAMVLGSRALWLVVADSPELRVALQGARARAAGADAPLPPAQRTLVDALLPAMARVLEVAPPDASDDEVATLALQEWVRECQDELMHESAVLHELHAMGGLHIVRATCEAPSGKLQLV